MLGSGGWQKGRQVRGWGGGGWEGGRAVVRCGICSRSALHVRCGLMCGQCGWHGVCHAQVSFA